MLHGEDARRALGIPPAGCRKAADRTRSMLQGVALALLSRLLLLRACQGFARKQAPGGPSQLPLTVRAPAPLPDFALLRAATPTTASAPSAWAPSAHWCCSARCCSGWTTASRSLQQRRQRRQQQQQATSLCGSRRPCRWRWRRCAVSGLASNRHVQSGQPAPASLAARRSARGQAAK